MAALEIHALEVADDGKNLLVTFEVRNTTNRTLHFYGDLRGMRYDEASRTLRLLLTDRHTVEGPKRFAVMRPPLNAVDGGETEKVTLRVPRTMTQMAAEAPGHRGPTLRQHAVHESVTVEVELSWSDKPFYPEPKSKSNRTEQLRRWEQGVIEAKLERGGKGESAPPSTPSAPKNPRKK